MNQEERRRSDEFLALSADTHEQAHDIMGDNFFGVGEASDFFGNPTRAQLLALSEIPFSESVLRECKDSHFLIAVLPRSILDIYRLNKWQFPGETGRHKGAFFAMEQGEAGWHLVRRTPVQGSTGKSWGWQWNLLEANEEVPTARVVAYTMTSHFLRTGERLFGKVRVRCPEELGNEFRVSLGHSEPGRLCLGYDWDKERDATLGLSSERKPE